MIIYVYDGAQESLSHLKGVYEVDNLTELSKATNQERYSTVTLLGPSANLVNKGDVIKIESNYFNGWGFIIEPTITHHKDVCETSIAIETDGLISDAYNTGGNATKSDIFTFIYDNYDMLYKWWHPHRILQSDKTTFSGYVTFTDFELPLAQMLRQLFRQGIRVHTYVNNDNILCFKPYRDHLENTVMFNINLDGVLEYEFEASKNSYNSIRIFRYNSAGTVAAYFGTYFLTKSGGLVYNPATEAQINSIQRPVQSKIEVFDYETSIDSMGNEVANMLLNMQYQNSLTITVNREWLYFNELFKSQDNIYGNLGARGYITLPSGIRLITNLEEITLRGSEIMCTFGLGTKKLFDRIYEKR